MKHKIWGFCGLLRIFELYTNAFSREIINTKLQKSNRYVWKKNANSEIVSSHFKGQLISKCLFAAFNSSKKWMKTIRLSKGQLNSEWIYEVIISPKMQTNNCQDFWPHYTGQMSWHLFIFWENRWLHKLILKSSDL